MRTENFKIENDCLVLPNGNRAKLELINQLLCTPKETAQCLRETQHNLLVLLTLAMENENSAGYNPDPKDLLELNSLAYEFEKLAETQSVNL